MQGANDKIILSNHLDSLLVVSLPDPKGQMSYCHHLMFVIVRPYGVSYFNQTWPESSLGCPITLNQRTNQPICWVKVFNATFNQCLTFL